jgi:fructokinase
MRIGIDLGGTKIAAALLDDSGDIIAQRREATPQGDYHGTVNTIKELVLQLEAQSNKTKQTGPCSVGIGIPGAISLETGRIKNANSVCLIGKDLAADLMAALKRPVRLANDADCFCLSEATDGAAQGHAMVFGVILGTGVGGGIVCNGQLLQGPNAISGEWGHNPLPWPDQEEMPGPNCYCGRRGCIETFLSGPGLAHSYFELTSEQLPVQQIVHAATEGNKLAKKVMQRYENQLARALAAVINLLDPHVIVLGGGLSNIKQIYTNVPTIWDQYVFSDRVDTILTQAKHGDASGVRGAAWLWPKGCGKK